MKRAFIGTSLIGSLFLSAHQPTALGQVTPNNSFTVDYSGITYQVDTYGAGKTYQDTKNLISPLEFKNSTIWNDPILASNIAQSTADKGRSITFGANPYASIYFPYEEYQGDIFVQKSLFGGNITTDSLSQTFGFPGNGWAIVNPLSQPQPATKGPIDAAGNVSSGNGNNKTSNLGTSLLPQFEGGTLTVDQANQTYNQDFTLNGSNTNTISNGSNFATFSGVFSDALPGNPGNIVFEVGTNPIQLSGANTYTGSTTISCTPGALGVCGSVAALVTRNGAIPDSSDVYFSASGGALSLIGDEKLASLNASSAGTRVYLQGNNLEIGSTNSISSEFAGSIEEGAGLSSITKSGSNTQVFSGVNNYSGATNILGGTLALSGNGSIAESRLVGIDQQGISILAVQAREP